MKKIVITMRSFKKIITSDLLQLALLISLLKVDPDNYLGLQPHYGTDSGGGVLLGTPWRDHQWIQDPWGSYPPGHKSMEAMLERYQEEILEDLNNLGRFSRYSLLGGAPVHLSAYVVDTDSEAPCAESYGGENANGGDSDSGISDTENPGSPHSDLTEDLAMMEDEDERMNSTSAPNQPMSANGSENEKPADELDEAGNDVLTRSLSVDFGAGDLPPELLGIADIPDIDDHGAIQYELMHMEEQLMNLEHDISEMDEAFINMDSAIANTFSQQDHTDLIMEEDLEDEDEVVVGAGGHLATEGANAAGATHFAAEAAVDPAGEAVEGMDLMMEDENSDMMMMYMMMQENDETAAMLNLGSVLANSDENDKVKESQDREQLSHDFGMMSQPSIVNDDLSWQQEEPDSLNNIFDLISADIRQGSHDDDDDDDETPTTDVHADLDAARMGDIMNPEDPLEILGAGAVAGDDDAIIPDLTLAEPDLADFNLDMLLMTPSAENQLELPENDEVDNDLQLSMGLDVNTEEKLSNGLMGSEDRLLKNDVMLGSSSVNPSLGLLDAELERTNSSQGYLHDTLNLQSIMPDLDMLLNQTRTKEEEEEEAKVKQELEDECTQSGATAAPNAIPQPPTDLMAQVLLESDIDLKSEMFEEVKAEPAVQVKQEPDDDVVIIEPEPENVKVEPKEEPEEEVVVMEDMVEVVPNTGYMLDGAGAVLDLDLYENGEAKGLIEFNLPNHLADIYQPPFNREGFDNDHASYISSRNRELGDPLRRSSTASVVELEDSEEDEPMDSLLATSGAGKLMPVVVSRGRVVPSSAARRRNASECSSSSGYGSDGGSFGRLSGGVRRLFGSGGSASLAAVGYEPFADNRPSRDDKLAARMGLPYSTRQLIDSSVDQFNKFISDPALTRDQVKLCKDIRRRGKNKVAAQNCRRRKLETIEELQSQVESVRRRREELMLEWERLEAERRHWSTKLELLEQQVLSGLHKNVAQFTIQVDEDGVRVRARVGGEQLLSMGRGDGTAHRSRGANRGAASGSHTGQQNHSRSEKQR